MVRRHRAMSRRQFLAGAAMVTTGALAGCAPAVRPGPATASVEAPRPASTGPAPTEDAPGTPTDWMRVVAIGRCETYDEAAVEAAVRDLVTACGGLGEVVRSGSTVVIKPNFTAGGLTPTTDGLPNNVTYTTHPAVVRAIGLLAREAGAARIILTEGWGDEVWALNGYEACIDAVGAETVDSDDPAPAADFVSVAVPDALALDTVLLHQAIVEADAFISVPKIKCHASAGITLSIKNVFGCTPLPRYRQRSRDQYRSTMHAGNLGERLPRILVDVLKARPIDFAVVDGISTIDQGEGPWIHGSHGAVVRTVEPHLLMAGRNPVALDAVGVAVMGFDPAAPGYSDPFPSSQNHIALAAEQGLGTNRLDEIEVRGLSIEEARFPFTPCPKTTSDGAHRMHLAMLDAARRRG